MIDRLRGFLDVNLFVFRRLNPPNSVLLIVSTIVFVGGLLLWLRDESFSATGFVSAGLGILGMSKDAVKMSIRWLRAPRAILKSDESTQEIIQQLQLDCGYRDDGYVIIEARSGTNEKILISPDVNRMLRAADVEVVETLSPLETLNRKLAENGNVLEDVLRCKYRQSVRRVPARTFLNEDKTSLATDLTTQPFPINISRGSYYHSFLTNELVGYKLESVGPRPQILFHGSDHYPATPLESGALLLKSISESNMGNHIGISTLVHTSDGKIVVWRQSGGAQQSQNLLAPTGSGSCDWRDWTKTKRSKRTLNALISHAMEREFLEESNALSAALREANLETAVLGYFRWLRRGGKPEFVGITSVNAPVTKLAPNVREVDAPEFVRLTYPAASIAQLTTSIAELMDSAQVSVPLWVTLTCLAEAIEEDPNRWARFLGIPLTNALASRTA